MALQSVPAEAGRATKESNMKSIKEDVPNADQREVETRRIGLQDKLVEKVVDTKEDKLAQKDALKERQRLQGHE
jgi:hypothetical protein